MKQYRMTDEQLASVLSACEPVPLIMLQCGGPRDPQERINQVWKAVAEAHGVDTISIVPGTTGDNHDFMAEPKH